MKKQKIYKTKIIPIITIFAAISAMAAAGLLYHFHFSERPCKYEYNVACFSVIDQALQVDLTISNVYGRKAIALYKGDVDAYDQGCTGNDSNKVVFTERDAIIALLPDRKLECIHFSYKVKIGSLGKHGYRGHIYEDLTVFDGQAALILPMQAYNTSDMEIGRDIRSISVVYDIPEGWAAVIPYDAYGAGNAEKHVTSLEKPTWSMLYDLRKSSFAFGRFEKKEYNKGKDFFTIWIDPASRQAFTEQAEKGINALYDYYARLFGYDLSDFSLVLLRKDYENGIYLMGGVSNQTLGSTFDPGQVRDWELMGHRLFHAFFERRITLTAYHEPSLLWFYEGLATYYENMSMGSLPAEIREALNIRASDNFAALFREYAYMHLKDPKLFSITPMNEKAIQNSGGLEEFLHYTQAPLVIKALEDETERLYNSRNKALRFIMTQGNHSGITAEDIVTNTLGSAASAFIEKYLTTGELPPFPREADGVGENQAQVLAELNEIENTLWSWFRLENPNYPKDILSTEGLEKISAAAEKAGVRFADASVEESVKALSPTVYMLLKQYAYKAQICKLDPSEPALRYKLLGIKENVEKWTKVFNSIV